MRLWHKIVSSAVLAAILLLPLLALAMCRPETAASMQCPPHCPMMAKMKSQHDGAAAKADNSGSCCQIKNSRPAPITESKAVPPVVSTEPVLMSVQMVSVETHPTTEIADTSPPLGLATQARLCTFQI